MGDKIKTVTWLFCRFPVLPELNFLSSLPKSLFLLSRFKHVAICVSM